MSSKKMRDNILKIWIVHLRGSYWSNEVENIIASYKSPFQTLLLLFSEPAFFT